MAANNISTEKVDALFFNKENRRGDISGNIPSDHSVTRNRRRGRRTKDKVKIQDDEQFTGRAYQVSTADASCIKGSVGFGVDNGEVGTLSIWFKLNSINTGTFFHGVYDTVRLWNSGTQIKLDGNTNAPGTPAIFDIPIVKVNTWYHLVVFLDGVNDQAKVWLNGVESASGNQVIIPELSALVRIGIYHSLSSINLDGHIAHVGRWSRELSQQEVEDLYRFDIPTSQIDFYLPLEQSGDDENVLSIVPGVNSFTAENFVSGDWVEDSEFPYSHLNKMGYNDYKGLTLNGTDQYLSLSSNDIYSGQTGIGDFLVIQIVLKLDTLPVINDHIFSTYNASDSDFNIFTTVQPTGQFRISIDTLIGGSTSSDELTSTSSIVDGTLKRVTALMDIRSGETQRWRIYINGALDIENDIASGLNGYNQNHIPTSIGRLGDYTANSNFHFGGDIYSISIYNASNPLSLTQVEELASKGVISTNPSHEWVFDNESGVYPDVYGGITATLQNQLDGMLKSTVLPAALSGDKDLTGVLLKYKGELAPRIQLVNAPCVVLNGTDQSINLPDETQVAGGQDTTFWFKVKIDPESGDYTVFGSGDLSLFRWSTSNTTIRLRGHTNSAENIMTFPHSIRTGEWQDIVLIRRVSDSKFTCYINGVQNTEGYISVNSGNSFRIDSLGEGSTRWTDGEISLFGKWFRSFSLAEIQALPTRLPSLNSVEHLYVFSEGNGTTIYDVSGNNNHGEVINAVLPDIWGTQNVYHYNFFKGFVKSLKNMDGVEAFFDFTSIDSYTFNPDGSVATITDQVNKYVLSNTHSDSIYSNNELSLTGNYLEIDGDHFLRNLDQFEIFLRCSFKPSATSGTAFLYLNQGDNNEVWQVGKHPIGSFKRIFYNADSDTPAHDDAQVELATFDFFDEYINYSIKHDGSNLFSSSDSNTLVDAGITIKPKDNPLLNHLNFGVEGSQKYLIVFNRNVTDDERFFINAFMESGLAPEGALSGLADKRGYEVTGQYNGASDIQFPDVPEVPADLRGNTFTKKEVEGLVYAGRVLSSDKDLVLFREKVESIHFQRKGSGLILDDYPATCPSTALQKIHSDFEGNILTVRNEDNLQDASFGFDQYGRLPEADIVDHLNGAANGRVTSYYFQDVNHAGAGYTQSELSKMPYIAKSGVIQKDSRGLPALRFDGAQSLEYESQTAFKSMHDGSRGVQVIGFQVDEGQGDFWLVGNTDFQGQVGFEFFGDVFNQDKLHFIIRTNTSGSAIQDLDIPVFIGEYNRLINYIDPSNPVAIERHIVLVNELESAANTATELPDAGNTEDGTTSVGALGIREMEGYINELIFIGDHKADMLKLSRSLMFMP